MKRYYSPIDFTATDTGSVTGFPGSNVESRYIEKFWKAETAGDSVVLSFSSATPVAVMVVGTNATTLTFDGTAYSVGEAVSSVSWPDGVRFALSTTGLTSGTTITITPSGTITDGESRYSIGAVYIMQQSADVKTPLWGLEQVMRDPSITRTTPNGRQWKFRTGPRQMLITGQVRPEHSDDFEQIFRDDGVQILDAETSRTNYVWPVEWLGTEHVRTGGYAVDSAQFTFRRVN